MCMVPNCDDGTPKADLDRSTSSFADADVLDLSTTQAGSDAEGKSSENSSNEPEVELKEKLIKREQKAVAVARYAVFGAITLAAITVSALVYTFAHRSDKRTFQLEYDRVTKTLTDQVQLQVQYNFALMQMLSAEMTTAAVLTDAAFPNFTHPQFEVHGGYTDGMGGIMMAAYVPLVDGTKQAEWEAYALENQGWLEESARLRDVHPFHRDPLKGTFQSYEGDRRMLAEKHIPEVQESVINPYIFRLEENGTKTTQVGKRGEIMGPLWQSSPRNADAVNVNLLADERIKQMYDLRLKTKTAVMSPGTPIGLLFDWMFDDHEKDRKVEPHSFLLDMVYPRFDHIESENGQIMEPVGLVIGLTSYRNFFDKSLPEGTNGIVCVVEEPCGTDFTYAINGKKGSFIGFGDHHDRAYNEHVVTVPLGIYDDDSVKHEFCPHTLKIYPSEVFEAEYMSNRAFLFTTVVLSAWGFTALVLIVYDILVTRRQNKTMEAAVRTNNIVAKLFPKEIHDRLMQEDKDNAKGKNKGLETTEIDQDGKFKTAPIADFFPDTTVFFSDLVGFTAWSSVREPAQVFLLLETIYHAFDAIANRRKVFKVETVGDCYVAATGLPKPRKDHAVVMARFARDCMYKVQVITKELEKTLGPDTGELTMRMGIHSGPVTAGVLRGERSRFQLFGDTMNTCARIESSGTPNRIHLSSETADLIIAAGKKAWVTPREDQVVAKGKGVLNTFWLNLELHSGSSSSQEFSKGSDPDDVSIVHVPTEDELKHEAPSQQITQKMARLVDWNVDVLHRILKQVVARRNAAAGKQKNITPDERNILKPRSPDVAVIDEVAEIIQLPKFDPEVAARQQDLGFVELPAEVLEELRHLVTHICSLYRDNPFHNFEHASHVTMSVTKLLSRIIAPTCAASFDEKQEQNANEVDASSLHDYTFGITSDPLTQFSCVLSGLIHDLDHPGVPNAQLVKEGAKVAEKYKGQSVAEQNSVDLAWELLSDTRYSNLRACIYTNDAELARFRQLVVNAVMATDIVDKELKQLRNDRWAKAFAGDDLNSEAEEVCVNRKATIVIEHLLQASDVAHTMQHWHIYRKWNEKFFLECYKAWRDGRAGNKDPSEIWYKGEIGFFDFYIIPLAKKLKECGVFGVASAEYLNYAIKNRQEWESRGNDVVADMIAKAKETYG